MLNAIREMIVNGIVMQRVYTHIYIYITARTASIFGRSLDYHPITIPILKQRVKSDFQSGNFHSFAFVPPKAAHRSSKILSSLSSLSIGQRERETFATEEQKSAVKEKKFERKRRKNGEKGRKKGGIHNQFTKREPPIGFI